MLPTDAPPGPETTVACALDVEKGLMHTGVLLRVSLDTGLYEEEDEVPGMTENRDTPPCVIEVGVVIAPKLSPDGGQGCCPRGWG